MDLMNEVWGFVDEFNSLKQGRDEYLLDDCKIWHDKVFAVSCSSFALADFLCTKTPIVGSPYEYVYILNENGLLPTYKKEALAKRETENQQQKANANMHAAIESANTLLKVVESMQAHQAEERQARINEKRDTDEKTALLYLAAKEDNRITRQLGDLEAERRDLRASIRQTTSALKAAQANLRALRRKDTKLPEIAEEISVTEADINELDKQLAEESARLNEVTGERLRLNNTESSLDKDLQHRMNESGRMITNTYGHARIQAHKPAPPPLHLDEDVDMTGSVNTQYRHRLRGNYRTHPDHSLSTKGRRSGIVLSSLAVLHTRNAPLCLCLLLFLAAPVAATTGSACLTYVDIHEELTILALNVNAWGARPSPKKQEVYNLLARQRPHVAVFSDTRQKPGPVMLPDDHIANPAEKLSQYYQSHHCPQAAVNVSTGVTLVVRHGIPMTPIQLTANGNGRVAAVDITLPDMIGRPSKIRIIGIYAPTAPNGPRDASNLDNFWGQVRSVIPTTHDWVVIGDCNAFLH